MHYIKYGLIGLCVINLSSCIIYEDSKANYQAYDASLLYPRENYGLTNYGYQPSERRVEVPDSYHVGEYHSPTSFKDRDKEWVSNQNPESYTIEVANGEKASQVAQTLSKTPKNDRMAQVKYERGGKSYYRGLYGTYPTAEAAKKALDALPPEIKQGAGVKNWNSVQSEQQY